MAKLAISQAEDASTIICWPVLKPQMTGEPVFPGAVTEKVPVVQSPIETAIIKKKFVWEVHNFMKKVFAITLGCDNSYCES